MRFDQDQADALWARVWDLTNRTPGTDRNAWSQLTDLQEAVDDLDQHLRVGGRLPRRWAEAQRPKPLTVD